MKLPGLGEVKTPYVVGGGAFLFGVVGYAYYKNKKAAAAAAASAATSNTAASTDVSGIGAGGSGIDPNTGVPYVDEGNTYGSTYGGIDPATGEPYYDEITQSSTTTNPNAITTNQQWIEQAEADAQNLFGATYALAVQSVEDFISQTTKGLPPSEYQLMQSVVAELGLPPVGGPYRLIQGGQGTNPVTGGNPPNTGAPTSLQPGQQIKVKYAVRSPATVASVASKFGTSVGAVIVANPGMNLSAGSTGVIVEVPWLVKAGQTLASIADQFGISAEDLALQLSGQGIV